ncbi:hypothetical protein [Roseateles sp. L2-2]|uniref:hypothetical protein n=1 Tax=Roseateles sp. L2-2 TaxID=3422597 RepID=UPI003D35A972
MRSDGITAPLFGGDRTGRTTDGARAPALSNVASSAAASSAASGAEGAAVVATRSGVAAARGARAGEAPAVAVLSAAPLRAGDGASSAREPGAQLQLGKLQQGLDYLDRLAAAMQQLKGGLSDTLARQAAPSAAVNGQLDQLRQLWSQRSRDAGGRVDAELQAAPEDGAARQRFKLRGLDLAVLQQGGKETLRLQLPGQAQDSGTGGGTGGFGATGGKPTLIAVTLDGEGTQQQLQALTKALSPAGLSVQAQGTEIVFSVAESQWPALRDGLTLRGEGKRFPSGQPVRALLEPSPEALQPQRWDVKEASGQRQALGQLLQAQPKVAQARARLHEQLESAARPTWAEGEPLSPAQAGALAGSLAGALSGAEYSDVGALLPALRGMHRQRVRQLLSS